MTKQDLKGFCAQVLPLALAISMLCWGVLDDREFRFRPEVGAMLANTAKVVVRAASGVSVLLPFERTVKQVPNSKQRTEKDRASLALEKLGVGAIPIIYCQAEGRPSPELEEWQTLCAPDELVNVPAWGFKPLTTFIWLVCVIVAVAAGFAVYWWYEEKKLRGRQYVRASPLPNPALVCGLAVAKPASAPEFKVTEKPPEKIRDPKFVFRSDQLSKGAAAKLRIVMMLEQQQGTETISLV